MKTIANISGSALLIFVAVSCTLGALISAFSFTVSVRILFFVWLLSAIAMAIAAIQFRSKGILTAFIPVLLLLFWQWQQFVDGFRWVAYTITETYNQWLPVRIFFSEIAEHVHYDDYYMEPTSFFMITGLLLSGVLAAAICLRRSLFLTILFTIPPILLTFVITHIQSDISFIFGVLAVYITIFFSNSFHPDSFIKRGFGLIPAFVFALSFLGITYLIAAPERHDRENLAHTVTTRVRNVGIQLGLFWQGGAPGFDFGWLAPGGNMWQFDTRSVDIADAGTRLLHGVELLEVTSSRPGAFYLRGYSMAYFDGRSWHSDLPETPWQETPERIPLHIEEAALGMPALIAYTYSNLDIPEEYPDNIERLENPPISANMIINRISDVTNVSYWPYYRFVHRPYYFPYNDRGIHFFHTRDSIHMIEQEIRQVQIAEPLIPDPHVINTLSEYTSIILNDGRYTSIDPDMAEALRDIALQAGIDPDAARYEIADSVAQYVRRSALYSLQPELTPYDADFTLHFLQTAESGFCIHFATAATMMLRALDIPARFTVGYIVQIRPNQVGQAVTLTDENAHAWVEVFYDDIGWLYLEVTPSTGYNMVPRAIPHSPHTPGDAVPNGAPFRPDYPDYPDYLPNDRLNGQNGTVNGHDGHAATGAAATEVHSAPDWLTFLIIVSFFAVCLFVLFMRSIIARRIRARRFTSSDTNYAVIRAWRYIIRFKRNNIVIPSKIEDIALKASFSRHRLSEDERNTVIKYATQIAKEVYNGSENYARLWLKYVRAVV